MSAPSLPTPPTLGYASDSFDMERAAFGVVIRVPAEPFWWPLLSGLLVSAWAAYMIYQFFAFHIGNYSLSLGYFLTFPWLAFISCALVGSVIAIIQLIQRRMARNGRDYDLLFLGFADALPGSDVDAVLDVQAVKGAILLTFRRETKIAVKTRSGKKYELSRNLPYAQLELRAARLREALHLPTSASSAPPR